MTQFKAAIFDLGGTLIDDRNMVYVAFANMFKEFGAAAPSEEEFDKGFTSNWLEIFSKRGIDVDREKAINELEKITTQKSMMKNIRLYGGTLEALQAIKKKMKIALNTSYRKKELGIMMESIPLPKFDAVATGDDLETLKPNPRSINEICKKLGIAAKDCVMIGDTSSDILCGKNAGTKTIAVTWGTNTEHDLERLKPDLVAYTWKDILEFLGV